MPIRVQLPNGQIAEFPDGMPQDQIEAALRAVDPISIAPNDSNLGQARDAGARALGGVTQFVGEGIDALAPDRAAPAVLPMSGADYADVGDWTPSLSNLKNAVNRGAEIGAGLMGAAGRGIRRLSEVDSPIAPSAGVGAIAERVLGVPERAVEASRVEVERQREAEGRPSLMGLDRQSVVNRAGAAVGDFGQQIKDTYTGEESAANAAAFGAAYDRGITDAALFAVQHPGATADVVLPSLIEFAIPGGLMGRGMRASKLAGASAAAERAAARVAAEGGDALAVQAARAEAMQAGLREAQQAAGVTSATVQAGQSAVMQGQQAFDQVAALDRDQLVQFPGFEDIEAQVGFERAREIAARMAGDATAAGSAVINLVTYVGAQRAGLNPFESKIAGGPSMTGRAAEAAGLTGRLARGGINAAEEAAGEFVQGAGEQLGQNLGAGAADRRVDPFADVAKSGALEAMIGGPVGGLTGLMSAPTPRAPVPAGSPADQASPQPDPGTPAGRGAATADALMAEAGVGATPPPLPPATTTPGTQPAGADEELDAMLAAAGVAPDVVDPEGLLGTAHAAQAPGSFESPLPEDRMGDAPVGSWVSGPAVPGADTRRVVMDIPIDQIDATEFDSAGRIAPEKRADAERYAEAMRAGEVFPNARGSELPSGKIKLQDGHRRLAAAMATGATTLRVAVSPIVLDVPRGTEPPPGATLEQYTARLSERRAADTPAQLERMREDLSRYEADAAQADEQARLRPGDAGAKRYAAEQRTALARLREQLAAAEGGAVEPVDPEVARASYEAWTARQPAPSPAEVAPGTAAPMTPERADLDLPSFGHGAWPITVPDTDPLWRGIPDGQTSNIATPEREQLRNRIVKQHFRGASPAPADRKPVAYLMGGGGASGKGTLLRALQDQGRVPTTGVVELDPDRIKTGDRKHGIDGLPEYGELVRRGDSRAAAVVHEESSDIAAKIRKLATAGRYDMILDRTLGDPAKARAELQALRDAGYEVRLFGMTLDPNSAIDRAYSRAKSKGRYVPTKAMLTAHKGFAEGFETYLPYVDEAELYDNTGNAPELIGRSVGGVLEVANKAGYDAFKNRRNINEKSSTHRELADSTHPDADPSVDAGAVGGGEAEAGRGAGRARDADAGAAEPAAEAVAAPAGPAATVAEAAAQAATSPENGLPEPTDAQKKAGNYAKGKLRIDGLDFSIENPAGSRRRPEWPPLKHAYGYVRGSEGADGDHVDVFLADEATDTSRPVFVIDQRNRNGTFDEHKVMLGFESEAAARAGYLSNYTRGWDGLGAITRMTWPEFKDWVRDPANTGKPIVGKGDPLAAAVARTMKAQGAEGALPRVKIVDSADDLPPGIRSQIDGETDGLYDPNKGIVFLIRSALPTEPEAQRQRAVWVVWHELAGHFGLRRAFPGQALASALQAAGTNPTVRALADAIAAERGATPGQALGRELATEEALAELAAALRTGDTDALAARYGVEVPADATGVLAAIARVIKAIKASVVRAFGGTMPYSDAQVRQLLENAMAAVREAPAAEDGGADMRGALQSRRKPQPGTPEPLYASRPVVDDGGLRQWALDAGIADPLPADQLHLTVAYSKAPVDVADVPADTGTIRGKAAGTPYQLRSSLMMPLYSPQARADHARYVAAGASHDYGPDYRPHVSIKYDPTEADLRAAQDAPPFRGTLTFGAEEQAPLQSRRSINFSSLPEDMRVLLTDLIEDGGAEVPRTLPLRTAPISSFPTTTAGGVGDTRDAGYVNDMRGQKLPPLIAAGGRLLDGRHRLMAMRMDGVSDVEYIDLSHLIEPPKAPNIGEIKAPLQSRRQTDTAAFKRWFGDSKVVDADGEPLVVYHATDADFDTFVSQPHSDIGFHFGSADAAAARADQLRDGIGRRWNKRQERTLPVYLSIKNPLRVSDYSFFSISDLSAEEDNLIWELRDAGIDALPGMSNREAIKAIEAAGYDGLVYENIWEGGGDSWAAFRPEQIKSATANSGAFDSSNPSILQSRRTPAEAVIERNRKLSGLRQQGYPVTSFAQSGSTWQQAARTRRGALLQEIRRVLQDRMISVRSAQADIEAAIGRPISDLSNLYRAENLMHGKAADGVRRVREKLVDPLKAAVKASGLSVAEIERYLWAQHALERNKRIAKINPALKDGGSGLSNADAQAIIAAAQSGPKAAELARISQLAQDLRVDTLNTLRNSGQITPEEYRALRKMYQHYVPLRGHAGVEGEARVGAGRGIDMRGKPVRRALGRTSQPANILGELVGDAERAQVQAAKSEVGRTLLRAALEHPNPDFWRVEPVRVEPRFSEATGEVYMGVANDMSDEEVVIVKHRGQPYQVRLVDPGLREAMKNVGVEGFEGVSRYLGWLNRWLSAVFTRFNPAFVPVNMLRDMLQGGIGVASELGGRALGKIAASYPKAAAGLYAEAQGRGDASVPDAQKSWADWAREFMESGAATGYQTFADPESLQRQIELEMAGFLQLVKSGKPISAVSEAVRNSKTMQTIETANEIIENTMRLSVYVQRRQAGLSRPAAAEYAKNLTVNFNRKGTGAAVGNALFLFFNASMQGTHRTVRLLRDPRVLAGLSALGLTQFALATTMGAARYEDEDETLWEQIPDHVKQKAFVIPLGYDETGGPQYVAVPMPFGFNLFTYTGGYPANLMSPTWRSRNDPVRKTMGDIARAGVDAFSVIPVGDEGWYFPTVVRIFSNLNANKDDLGRRIRDEGAFEKFERPRSSMGKADTPGLYKDIATALNRIGGGDDYTKPVSNLLDWAPEDIEYLMSTFTGGPGTALQQLWRSGERAGAGLPTRPDDIPITRRLVGSQGKAQVDSAAYYDSAETLERGLARMRDAFAEGGAEAFYAQRDQLGPQFEGVDLAVYKTSSRDGTRVAGTVKISGSGEPELEAVPGSTYAAYKDAAKAVKAYGSAIRRLYADDTLTRLERRREIDRLQVERAAAMRSFVNPWNKQAMSP